MVDYLIVVEIDYGVSVVVGFGNGFRKVEIILHFLPKTITFCLLFGEKYSYSLLELFEMITISTIPRDGMVRIENRKLYSNLMKI